MLNFRSKDMSKRSPARIPYIPLLAQSRNSSSTGGKGGKSGGGFKGGKKERGGK